jgi:hypothetical protein
LKAIDSKRFFKRRFLMPVDHRDANSGLPLVPQTLPLR